MVKAIWFSFYIFWYTRPDYGRFTQPKIVAALGLL